MSKSYKRWSKQEKIKILQAAEQEGVISACRKHEVSYLLQLEENL
jgi:transposase-like protein